MIAADDAAREQAVAWARSTVERAVQLFIDQGVVEAALLEAKPAWCIPPEVLIAMLREKGAARHSFWLICGDDVPFDYVASPAATSAREAARHFALKWQLEAARMRDSTAAAASPDGAARSDPEGAGTRLEAQAELLYRLVGDDGLWQQGWSAGL